MDIRKHPSVDAGEQDEEDKEEDTAESEQKVNLTAEKVNQRLKEYVLNLIPNADLIREFNGNFTYLVPNNNRFNPSKIYLEIERNKERLHIQDWGLCQSSLEDVFTKICALNGDNND